MGKDVRDTQDKAVEAEQTAGREPSDRMRRVTSALGEVASEDARLVGAAQDGNRDAFARLFERHRGPAYGIAYRLLGRREDALDAVQEAFTKAFAAIGTFRGGASFRTWFFRIVTNCSLDMRRARTVRRTASLDVDDAPEQTSQSSDGEPPSRGAERRELKARIDAALVDIPETNRTAFVLFAVEGISYREIAEILNISIGTVMSRIFYARQKLQKILTQQALGPDAEGGNSEYQ